MKVVGFVEYGCVSVEQSAAVVNNPAFGKNWREKGWLFPLRLTDPG
jgi:hypothetical protein